MFKWLRQMFGSRQRETAGHFRPDPAIPSARPEHPVDVASLPKEASRMISLMEAHKDHPLVKEHFFQVAIITLIVPGSGQATMYLPEFRDGLNTSLIWDDAGDNWGSGGWIPIAHADADVTCPPSAFGVEYMRNNPAFSSVSALMDELYKTRPSR